MIVFIVWTSRKCKQNVCKWMRIFIYATAVFGFVKLSLQLYFKVISAVSTHEYLIIEKWILLTLSARLLHAWIT